ncbi:Mediator of rna polymerase ii transcription subunit [Thalictrum thalictroides]|uniref:Mediator of rna polymerase ii transcription subunit n=1 Tax=Thalictrum thalictroides TaxID=46969 RepID=A0A7J6XD73_THATH|nr:Mediator of rna polymerase ii transcription subunit [Thalictrum thalictroides]
MQSTFLCSSSSSLVLPPKPTLSQSKHKKRSSTKIYATRREKNGGSHVDEDMIVLRMRIHDIKMQQQNSEAPSNWMAWEKKYYANYDSDVCEAVGLLQSKLMNIRPSLAIGMAIFIALSVTSSTVLIVINFFEIAKWIVLSGFHIN